jgi:hypothetical protein
MCEKTKEKEEKPEIGDETSWSRNQKERDYYYDDAHGYEVYRADEDDEETEPANDKDI